MRQVIGALSPTASPTDAVTSSPRTAWSAARSSAVASVPRRPTWTTGSAQRRSPRRRTTSPSVTSTAPSRSPAPPRLVLGLTAAGRLRRARRPKQRARRRGDPATPARSCARCAVTGGRRLRTLRGTRRQLPRAARAGRRLVPRACRRRSPAAPGWPTRCGTCSATGVVDVRLERRRAPTSTQRRGGPGSSGRTPTSCSPPTSRDLGVEDARLDALFAELLDERGEA